jgi:glutathione S-transferase
MSIKHYFNHMSRGVTTDWMLRELDVPHEKIIIDTSAGKQNTPEYRAINPMGKLPVLVDGQTIVTETAAICAYLTDKFANKRFAPKINSAERAAYYRYLFIPGTTFEPAFSLAAVGFEHPQSESAGWSGRKGNW